ncbi:hypothetical protein CMUS01_07731 [Colletotrichum musicola]|uniref:Uncharacterized protein n=1 Tax=Colletotrichum musicola TaxID=2175873 RepID=A0A8H6KFL8_9PEZI|nr:hypothetical protein CMUS01_07731 [Colletotrichum musicola]
MIYCKAARLHDTDQQARVLATDSPMDQKRLGKGTVVFTVEGWDEMKSAIVEAAHSTAQVQSPHPAADLQMAASMHDKSV